MRYIVDPVTLTLLVDLQLETNYFIKTITESLICKMKFHNAPNCSPFLKNMSDDIF